MFSSELRFAFFFALRVVCEAFLSLSLSACFYERITKNHRSSSNETTNTCSVRRFSLSLSRVCALCVFLRANHKKPPLEFERDDEENKRRRTIIIRERELSFPCARISSLDVSAFRGFFKCVFTFIRASTKERVTKMISVNSRIHLYMRVVF